MGDEHGRRNLNSTGKIVSLYNSLASLLLKVCNKLQTKMLKLQLNAAH